MFDHKCLRDREDTIKYTCINWSTQAPPFSPIHHLTIFHGTPLGAKNQMLLKIKYFNTFPEELKVPEGFTSRWYTRLFQKSVFDGIQIVSTGKICLFLCFSVPTTVWFRFFLLFCSFF